MQASMQQLHHERELLCRRLAAAAAPARHGSGAALGLPAAAAGAAAAAEAAAPPLLPFDALTEQSEVADLIAANTARMGGLVQLHFTVIYSLLTDVQRARMAYLLFPFPPNVAKCIACIAHMLKFEPASLPPAAELGLRSEMARWAPPPAAPAPQWRWAGVGGGGPAAGAAHGGSSAGAPSGDAASSCVAGVACPAASGLSS
jgi:hypothetical protein